MKLFSLIISILILYLIQVSVCDTEETDADINETTELAAEVLEEEPEDQKNMKEKMQVDPSEEDEDDLDGNGDNGGDIQNQDDDSDSNGEPTAQPNIPVPIQPNPDQSRVYSMPGSPVTENAPQPEYNPGYTPVSRLPQQCHGGQYQCQKTDSMAQTRCIPQEWRCNGLRDCELNDDESGCTQDQLSRGRTQTKCTHDQYQCHGSGINSVPPHCIDRRFVCDGTYHCSYGDDEANCADRRPSVYPIRVPQDRPTDSRVVDPRPIPDQNSRVDPRDNPRADPRDNSRVDPRDNRDMYRPQSSTGDRKSDEYVQRLEWRDRCFRSCLKY